MLILMLVATMFTANDLKQFSEGQVLRVHCGKYYVRLFAEPHSGATTIDTVKCGADVTFIRDLGKWDEWAEVRYGKKTGYLPISLLRARLR